MKPLATIVLSKMGAPGAREESEPGDQEELAGEILDAVKSGDKAALAKALSAYVMSCSEYSE